MSAALYAGGMEDWVDGHLGVDHAYSVQLFRPTDVYDNKLTLEVLTCYTDIN